MALMAAAAVALGHGIALAEEIRITAGHCSSEVHLMARDAHVSLILKRLSETLRFELHSDSASDPVVTIDTKGDAHDVLARLAPTENVSTTQARDPHCPERQRILQAWVLPKGQAGAARVAVSAPASPPALTPEQARLAQEGADMILRAHGIDPEEQAGSQ